MPILNAEQLDKLSEISNPLVRRRFSIFYQLPPDMQESMLAEGTAQSIWNITKEKYTLSDSNTSTVAKIIGLIFLGELPIKNFITALKDGLGVDIQKAQEIAQDINQAIFQPVRESLMQVHGLERGTTRIETRNNADKNQQIQAMTPQQPIRTAPPSPVTLPSREELLAKLKSQNHPVMQPPAPIQQKNPPFQARPAQYYIVPRKNIIDLRANKRKNSKRRKYNGFFASY